MTGLSEPNGSNRAASNPNAGGSDAETTRVARLAARLLGAAAALVWLVEGDQLVLVSDPARRGRTSIEVTSYLPWCRQVAEASGPIRAGEWRPDRLPEATAAPPPEALLGISLRNPDAQVIGALAVIDHSPRYWENEEADALRDLGVLLARELERQRVVKRQSELPAGHQPPADPLEMGCPSPSTLFASIRHAFGQPLTVIQGFSELIRDEALSPEEIRDYAAEISKEAVHLTELVARLR